MLGLAEKPDRELDAIELRRLIRDLAAEIAPIEARLRSLRKLYASRTGADESRRVRAIPKEKLVAAIRAAAKPMQEADEKGITAKLALKFDVSRRTVQRALKES